MLPQEHLTLSIIFLPSRIIMHLPIQLYSQFLSRAIKIDIAMLRKEVAPKSRHTFLLS